jgi:hypothetical protein
MSVNYDYPSEKGSAPLDGEPADVLPLDGLPKGRWERSWPVIACGAGLFSDGYLNGVCAPTGGAISVSRKRYHTLTFICNWKWALSMLTGMNG